jgi:hypothetical protein
MMKQSIHNYVDTPFLEPMYCIMYVVVYGLLIRIISNRIDIFSSVVLELNITESIKSTNATKYIITDRLYQTFNKSLLIPV